MALTFSEPVEVASVGRPENYWVSGVLDRNAARNLIAPGAQGEFTCGYTPLSFAGAPWSLRPTPEPMGPNSRGTPFVISEIHYHPAPRPMDATPSSSRSSIPSPGRRT